MEKNTDSFFYIWSCNDIYKLGLDCTFWDLLLPQNCIKGMEMSPFIFIFMVYTEFVSWEDQSVSDSSSECLEMNQLDQQWTLTYEIKPAQSWFICSCRSFTTKYSPSTSLVNTPDTEYLYPGVHSWSLSTAENCISQRGEAHFSLGWWEEHLRKVWGFREELNFAGFHRKHQFSECIFTSCLFGIIWGIYESKFSH